MASPAWSATRPRGFDRQSTRSPDELTGNIDPGAGPRSICRRPGGCLCVLWRHALKPGAPLAFTFHHNRIGSLIDAVGGGDPRCWPYLLDATLPCPAEMGGSIHIHGTGSSIVDSVFVCRSQGSSRPGQTFKDLTGLGSIILEELVQLRSAGMKPTAGDIRCIVFGHLTRMAVWRLGRSWNRELPTTQKLERFARAVAVFGDIKTLIDELAAPTKPGAALVAAPPLFA